MKKSLIILACAIISLALGARNISEIEAQRTAVKFINGTKAFKAKNIGLQQVSSANLKAENLYGFNIANGGYVLVSANSNAYQILGYADSGLLDTDNMPDNMRQWLKGYDEAIKALKALDIEPDDAPVVSGEAIEPLLATTWYQDAPYNILCPSVPNDEGGEEDAPTGCVATAMAQVMYYYKWPAAECTPIPGYEFSPAEGHNVIMDPLPSLKFDWDNMLLNYSDVQASEDQQYAVAELMQYCGQALKMMYMAGGSGAQETAIATAARTYFGYDKATKPLFRCYYSINQWENMIYDELKAGRPVPYAGQSGTSGHSFVCDGYDGNGLFHINWGWDGRSDGYFRLSVLNPFNNTSIGSSSSRMGYSYEQQAVFGMQPPTAGSEEYNQDIYFSLELPVTINEYQGKVTFQLFYECLENPKNTIVGALGTVDGDVFTPLYISNTVEADQNSVDFAKIDFIIDPESLPDGESILYLRAKPANGDYDWFTLASDDVYLCVSKSAEGMSLRMMPEINIEITDVFTEDNQAPAVEKKSNFYLKVKNNGDNEINSYVDVVFYQMGDVELNNQNFDDISTDGALVSGIFIRPNETDSILVRNSFSLPGNAAFIICEHGTHKILAKGAIPIAGDEIEFYDLQPVAYSVELDETGFLEATVSVRNYDSRHWIFPYNSNCYIRSYIRGEEISSKVVIQSGDTSIIPAMLDAGDFEPDENVHFVMEQVLGGVRTKPILELDLKYGEKIDSSAEAVIVDGIEENEWYNLQGIRISKPSLPGLYIHNGKKTLIR
ncbi:MAG: C10 family peptidase [Muribaculaceae bacterium]